MLLNDLQNKNILIWGLGKEGLAVVRFLQQHHLYNHLYLYNDVILSEKIEDFKIYSGSDIRELLNKTDVIIRSPGVSIYKEEIINARQRGIKITSSSDIFISEMRANHPETTVIGVSGSKGKSTTSSLLYHGLKSLGEDVALCGNIGRPLIELLDEQHRYVVCELSSYQSSDLSVSPQIVLFTNLFPEHIDWHCTHDNYYRDKVHLVAHQHSSDVCFVNAKCEKLQRYCMEYDRPYNYYNEEQGFAELNNILCRDGKQILQIHETKLEGYHNLDNMAGVLSVIEYLGLDTHAALESFKNFNALPHRLQKIGEKDGITFINDSISTAPETAIAAINSFDKPMGVFLGGYDRKQDYQELARFINDNPKVKVVSALFQTGARIAETIRREVKRDDLLLIEEADFPMAVKKLFDALKERNGCLALFSPAAPSYDVFRSFEERKF